MELKYHDHAQLIARLFLRTLLFRKVKANLFRKISLLWKPKIQLQPKNKLRKRNSRPNPLNLSQDMQGGLSRLSLLNHLNRLNHLNLQ